uniref:Uncharacterized protein n=1 Tax=Tetraodon nigroviridis TaxID=99883 RepID=H3CL18_TETNG
KRVFINGLESYGSKNIAAILYECVPLSAYDEDEAEEQQKAFLLVGSVDRSDRGALDGSRADERRPSPPVKYLYFDQKSDRDELLLKLMQCDVVIYNITDHADQVEEAFWAVSALHNQMEHFSASKMFILISTVMTWARTETLDPEDPTLPLTDELFWRRRPHPNFKSQCDLEKRVVKLGSLNNAVFSTYVLASGCLYGKGEQFLHYFFKTAWQGGQDEIPLFGDGSNIIPTIHISDLASVIQNVIERPPLPSYLLAVDNSNNTMEEIVEKVACVLGSGKIQKKPIEEAFLISDFSVMEIDTMQLDLCMDSVYIRELLAVKWLYESGIVENIERVVEEYRQSRQLLPIRACVLGPPAVGKSTVCEHISQHYKLHHISLKEIISETISQLEYIVKNADAEDEDLLEETETLLDSLRAGLKTVCPSGVLDEQLKVKVVKDKLLSKPCRNQGYVLDSFPETCEQARELFSSDTDSSEDVTSSISSRRIIPEFVFYLDASDEFLKDRVKSLPESVIQERNYEQEPFLQRLAKHREDKLKNETALEYFDDMDISPVVLKITSNNESDFLLLMHKLFEAIGQPRNYDISAQDGRHQESRKDEKQMNGNVKSSSLLEKRQREEEKQRAEKSEEWRAKLEKVKLYEDKLLEAHTLPVRNYLLEHVMPTLSQGLAHCCQSQPQDPVDFLAEYLLMNNPFNY